MDTKVRADAEKLTLPSTPFIIENLPENLRKKVEEQFKSITQTNDTSEIAKNDATQSSKKRLQAEEHEIEGGLPLTIPYSSKEWLGKTPKSYVMEFFQRRGLDPPKWFRESHSTKQLHLIKVTFKDPDGKDVTLYANRYFKSVKEAEHNTSILILCHLLPDVKSAQEIILKLEQLHRANKLAKRRKLDQKPLRMAHMKHKPKVSYAQLPNHYNTLTGPFDTGPGQSNFVHSSFTNFGTEQDWNFSAFSQHGNQTNNLFFNASPYYQDERL